MVKDCPTLYFIAGVTASGKSALAMDWAEKNNAEFYPVTRLQSIRE